MAENLGQADKIVAGVGKVLMRHRMPQKVGMQADAGDRSIFVAQSPNASFRGWASLPHGVETDRVALGGCPPRAPTDPNVRN